MTGVLIMECRSKQMIRKRVLSGTTYHSNLAIMLLCFALLLSTARIHAFQLPTPSGFEMKCSSWSGSSGYLDQLQPEDNSENEGIFESEAQDVSVASAFSESPAAEQNSSFEATAPFKSGRAVYQAFYDADIAWATQIPTEEDPVVDSTPDSTFANNSIPPEPSTNQEETQPAIQSNSEPVTSRWLPPQPSSTLASKSQAFVSPKPDQLLNQLPSASWREMPPGEASISTKGPSSPFPFNPFANNNKNGSDSPKGSFEFNPFAKTRTDNQSDNEEVDNLSLMEQGQANGSSLRFWSPEVKSIDPPENSCPTSPSSYLDQLASQDSSPSTAFNPNAGEEDRYLSMIATETNLKRLNGENPHAITEVPLNVVFDKWLDSVEDGFVEFWSQSNPFSRAKPGTEEDSRPTVVVLGTGWAAHSFVQSVNALAMKIIVVSPVNHFVFTPMLASAAVGTVEYRSMTEAIRVTNGNIENYIDGQATGIDVNSKELTVQLNAANRKNPFEPTDTSDDSILNLSYDYLVCAVGTKVRSSFVPGAAEYCYNLKTTQDSKRLRFAIGEALEYASRPDVQGDSAEAVAERQRRVRFLIIGGGATGVELAAELNDFVEEACRARQGAYNRLQNDVSIVLVHGGGDLLPQFDPALRQRALRALEDRGVQVKLNTYTTEVGASFVQLRNKESGEEETIQTGITAWGAGNEPVPFVNELLSKLPEEAKAPGGRIEVDRFLRCPTESSAAFGSIFVLGDVSHLSNGSSHPTTVLPQTAQVAGQQGEFLARLMNRGYVLSEPVPVLRDAESFWEEANPLRNWLMFRSLAESPEFKFLNLGLLAYVGGGQALTQVQLGDVPLLNLAGKRAFVLWRSVYLAKQAGSRNQAQLIFDWFKSQVFGRDITRL